MMHMFHLAVAIYDTDQKNTSLDFALLHSYHSQVRYCIYVNMLLQVPQSWNSLMWLTDVFPIE